MGRRKPERPARRALERLQPLHEGSVCGVEIDPLEVGDAHRQEVSRVDLPGDPGRVLGQQVMGLELLDLEWDHPNKMGRRRIPISYPDRSCSTRRVVHLSVKQIKASQRL